jgi:hypothetical protein
MQPKETEDMAAMEYGPGEEAEGDEGEESNAGDDTTLYCFCQKVSYGEVRYHPLAFLFLNLSLSPSRVSFLLTFSSVFFLLGSDDWL